MKKVAVVTGSNKGIGLAIIERLYNELKDKNYDVYLTSRNEENGRKALKELEEKGVKVCYHQLDITDDESVQRLADFLKEKYGGLDILVNNAAIAYQQSSTAPEIEQCEGTLRTNFFKTLDICNTLFPLLRPHARVVNVGSFVAFMGLDKCSKEVREKFTSCKSMKELVNLMENYIEETRKGTRAKNGYSESSYATSKIGISAMTVLQQKEFDKDAREDLIVNAADPGWVDTDMTRHAGPLTPFEGADTPCYLALLPENVSTPKGEHVSERKIKPWK